MIQSIQQQNEMTAELKKDLRTVYSVLKKEMYLSEKYPRFRVENLTDVLSIAIKLGIPVEEICSTGMYGKSYELTQSRGGFTFYISRGGYDLDIKTTHYKFKQNQWYIRFSCNGCGRLNIINDSNIAYQGEPDAVWNEFIDEIVSYSPLDYDDINGEYIFNAENGYKLAKDFSELYKNTCTKMKEAVKEYKIKKLQDEINKLKG